MRSRERVDANLNSLLPSHKEVLEFYDAHAWVHFKAVFILLLVKRYAFEYRKERFYALLEKYSIASTHILEKPLQLSNQVPFRVIYPTSSQRFRQEKSKIDGLLGLHFLYVTV